MLAHLDVKLFLEVLGICDVLCVSLICLACTSIHMGEVFMKSAFRLATDYHIQKAELKKLKARLANELAAIEKQGQPEHN